MSRPPDNWGIPEFMSEHGVDEAFQRGPACAVHSGQARHLLAYDGW